MKISIIIPVYNEKEVLKNCIESLSNQSLPSFEIIVVDDGSTDGILEVLRNLQSTISNFIFLVQKHDGTGIARNFGASRAKGEVLVFVDADMTFDRDFLKNLTTPIIDKKVKGTFSKEEYVANWDNIWARCWNINEGWEFKRRHSKNYPDHQPVFRAILKTEFDRVGGFTPGGYDDDWSLSKKLGYDAVNTPGAVFFHKNPSSLSEVYRQAKWAGKRKYKFGYFGYMVGLIRVFFPVSLIVGIYKSFVFKAPYFIFFKVVYDFAVGIGIIKYLLTGEASK